MAPRYQFTEIPNTPEGLEFVRLLRLYANTDRYTVRVKGQHLRPGENWRRHTYGQPIDKSTHIRIYFDDKEAKK
jgi:hypothetical protein